MKNEKIKTNRSVAKIAEYKECLLKLYYSFGPSKLASSRQESLHKTVKKAGFKFETAVAICLIKLKIVEKLGPQSYSYVDKKPTGHTARALFKLMDSKYWTRTHLDPNRTIVKRVFTPESKPEETEQVVEPISKTEPVAKSVVSIEAEINENTLKTFIELGKWYNKNKVLNNASLMDIVSNVAKSFVTTHQRIATHNEELLIAHEITKNVSSLIGNAIYIKRQEQLSK